MAVLTLETRVLEELRHSSRPLDDDELARRLDVTPRQTINQVCRSLAQAGRLRRYTGPEGKIVNDLEHVGSVAPSRPRKPCSADGPKPELEGQPKDLPPGNSDEQRRAERVMLEMVGERFGVVLAPRVISLSDGVRVEIDGVSDDLSILVEAWAHQGRPKAAQKNKVLSDTLKLLYVASTLEVSPRLVLCLSDPLAAHHFTAARSWAAMALRNFAVEVVVVELPAEVRAAVLAAQTRQFR
ncbi:hypothetical protein ACSDR0_01915 [Streptosporangium sp. G11]|uniref:hypothetical protein n=1 Tax=Streptosporangium sp. G11 TaxID=3436926 RepID=UPI003EC0E703